MEGRNSRENGEVTQEVEGEIQTGGKYESVHAVHAVHAVISANCTVYGKVRPTVFTYEL